MSLKVVSLASGSKGNATLILSDKTALLVDVGISYTRINNELKDFGLCASAIDGVIITHEHWDHICGLQRISQDCNVYAYEETKEAIAERIPDISMENFVSVDNYMDGYLIGDIFVKPFKISHDAVFPLGYTFECNEVKASVLTDTGTITRDIFDNIKDSEIVLLEANHDKDMLINGPYPFLLKKRILSNEGHLSNHMCSQIVEKLILNGRVQKILLGHLSEKNNIPEKAYNEVCSVVKNSEIEVYLTYPDRRSEVCEIL